MKRIFIGALLSILLSGFVKTASCQSAQYYFFDDVYYDEGILWELGGSINAMNCLTDLGGHKGIGQKFVKDLNVGKTEFSAGVFLSGTYRYAAAFRLEYTWGKVVGNDDVLKDVTDIARQRYIRNQNFRSKISEIALIVELHPFFIFGDYPAREIPPPRWSPYTLCGIGYFGFNPQTNYHNVWIDMKPLHTEGQGFMEYPERTEYKLQQINFPLGLGIRYELNSSIFMRFEYLFRILRTDYLDDVSETYINPELFARYLSGVNLRNALLINDRRGERDPGGSTISTKRGDPKQNDCYFTFNLKFGLNIGRQRYK